MGNINNEYWSEFYRDWDEVVKKWYEGRTNNQGDKVGNAYSSWISNLNLNELPTPYLGYPQKGVEAVIIDLNPGGSELIGFGRFQGEHSDATQDYSHINDDIGWLIREFRDTPEQSYRKFIDKWSCLNPGLRGHDPWVCGVNWWQGYCNEMEMWEERGEKRERELIAYHAKSNRRCRGYRIEWARRIYDKPWLSPGKVFALELCPFHSKNFKTKISVDVLRTNNQLISFIKKNVIDAAVVAMKEGKSPFALGVGSDLRGVLREFASIEIVWSHDDHPLDWDWPKHKSGTKRGQFVNRTYSLHTVTCDNGVRGQILVTSAPGGLTTPAPEFSVIEDHIREYASNLGREE